MQPKNNRIYLLIRRTPGLYHPSPPRLILRLATSGTQSQSQDSDSDGDEDDSEDHTLATGKDDDNDKAEDDYAQTRHTLFNPSTLTLNHLFHTLTLQYMHTHLLLHIKLGHQLAADVTIRSRHCLRTTTKQRQGQGREAYLKRLGATLQTARAFRKVLVSVELWSVHARTLPEQLDGVLDALLMPLLSVSKLLPSVTFSSVMSRREFNCGASPGRTNYIIIDLRSWASLAEYSWFWGKRQGIAVNILSVLTKWRKQERCLDWKGRLGADIRGERSLPGWWVWKDESDNEDGKVVFRLCGEKMKMVMEEFVKEFEGRMVVRGGCEWDTEGKGDEAENHDDDDEGIVVVV